MSPRQPSPTAMVRTGPIADRRLPNAEVAKRPFGRVPRWVSVGYVAEDEVSANGRVSEQR